MRVRRFVQSLPLWAEFAFVLAAAQGMFVYSSIRVLLHGTRRLAETDAGQWLLATHEAIVFLLIGAFLRARGWTLEHIGLIPGWRDTAIGIVLAGLVFAVDRGVYWAFYELRSPVMHELMTVHLVYRPFTAVSVAMVVLMNPLYEEVFSAGYLITALKMRFHPAVTIAAGVVLRILYHLYQGPISILHVVPLGVIFGLWYVRTGRLWPLVVAHAALDAFALGHNVQL